VKFAEGTSGVHWTKESGFLCERVILCRFVNLLHNGLVG